MLSPRLLLWGLLILGAANLLSIPAPDVPQYRHIEPFVTLPPSPYDPGPDNPNSECDPSAWDPFTPCPRRTQHWL